ncbi:hypothetical protein HT576_22435 [Haloterrigena sp. SYSU A121-1]|uniref:Uncharacterized protein n=1 Tax=Haloterrigena gelatinilytica TaxID=2741724 RepID=A0A8J8GP80_9EURY|nr:hypothetical protein [Haloterrigena gelatinilytica]NUB93739.1 hypothetical protein [Haloterrigena gelatinilytica]
MTDFSPTTEYEFRAVVETTADVVTGETIPFSTARERFLENTLLVDGVGLSSESHYEFTVSGAVEPSTDDGASIDDDVIDGGSVTGSVAGWRDAFRFSGDLESLTVDGRARVFVGDERVDPADYGGELSTVLTVVGNGTTSRYSCTADSSITAIDGGDVTVAGDSASGTINRGVHRFRLTGDLLEFTFRDGGTQVYLDSRRLDPGDYNGAPARPPHALVFDGTDATGPSQYTVTTSGEVTPSTYRGATIEAHDTITDTTIRGEVDAGDVDAYWFDGEITDFRLAGEAAVDVEYDVR